jgi:hypothetical protein
MTEIRHRKRLTPEERSEIEAFEARIARNGAYLGGVFEAAGWLGAWVSSSVVKGKRYSYGNLGGTLNDSEEATINIFQGLIGGRKYKEKGDNSWNLQISAHSIPAIASAIAEYAPSRREFIALAQLWEEMNIEERIEAVTEFRDTLGPGGRVQVSPIDYGKLICLPEFLAGVVDARGKPETVQRHGIRENTQDPIIRIGTSNIALLNALQPRYGGTVNESITGTENKQGITSNILLSHRKAFDLYRECRANLLVKGEAGDMVFSRYL